MEELFYKRFDLMAKYLYVKYKNINSNFFKELYKKHIITFNNCWEYPGTKTCIEDFYKSFDLLIEDMKKNGFDKKYPIPIGNNNLLINGSHRLIVSYFYNIEQIYVKENKLGLDGYNYNFFINRGQFPNLDRLYSDRMALEFIKLDKNMRIMITYPNINNNWDNLENIINKYGYLYYKKTVKLNDNGINNLIKELYRNEEWIGGLLAEGSLGKYNVCKGSNPINVYLIHMYDLDKLVELKNKCRELYNLGKHSLHMSDYTEDTFRIASSLLNENSIDFLNNGTNNLSEKTKNTLENYFDKLQNNNEDYCITSSVIMEMYGLDKNIIEKETENEINELINDDIIYNPTKHFYLNGYKFITLNEYNNLKNNLAILIIWPKYEDKIDILKNELKKNNYNMILKKIEVNKKFILNMLREIHYGKIWWDKNIENEYNKRINNENSVQNLNYFIIYKNDIYKNLKSLKKYIREKYSYEKCVFHISEPDCLEHLGLNCSCECSKNECINEYNKHLDMLTNKNTIHFLSNSDFNKTYKFYSFFDVYRNILFNNNINKNYFCIDNASILAVYGIRDTKDLDFLTLYDDNINMNNSDISCENKNHRLEYEKLGYSIKDIITEKNNYFYHFGIKFMSLEILKKFKYNRTHTIGTGHKEIRDKDINDYNLIKNYI